VAELKQYDITTETGYKSTLLLSDEDAKARGLLKEPSAKQAASPQNKQAKPASAK